MEHTQNVSGKTSVNEVEKDDERKDSCDQFLASLHEQAREDSNNQCDSVGSTEHPLTVEDASSITIQLHNLALVQQLNHDGRRAVQILHESKLPQVKSEE